MGEKQRHRECGPIYGVELLLTLPLDGGSMRQALPSRADLDDIRRMRISGSDRIVAGFEVLTEHYRRAIVARDRAWRTLARIEEALGTVDEAGLAFILADGHGPKDSVEYNAVVSAEASHG